MSRILALTVRPVEGPDTRYRIIQYMPLLKTAGVEVEHQSLLSSEFYRRQQQKRLTALDVGRYLAAVAQRAFFLLRHCHRYEAIWISRELSPLGPPLLERLLFSRYKGVVVFDFDDAIFEVDHLGGFLHRYLRAFTKYAYIAPRCAAIVCGNEYLAAYFRRFCPNVVIIPACVEHERYAAIERTPAPEGRTRIGWIGTATNQGHVELIRKPIEALAKKHALEFVTVGLPERLHWDIKHLRCLRWSLEEELGFFREFDIGVMPLEDTVYTRGKCAFKIVQYMAAGIPVVASPIGANKEVLEHGVQGLLAETEEEWVRALEALLLDARLRRSMGDEGRKRVRAFYSLEACWPRYADVLRGYCRCCPEQTPEQTLDQTLAGEEGGELEADAAQKAENKAPQRDNNNGS